MRYYLLFYLIVLLSCNSVTTDKSPAFHEKVTAPNDILSGEFDQIEHIFEYQNDTTYIINFWATWCKPCIEELPYFEQAYDAYKEDPVKLFLVSLDFPKHLESKLFPYVKKHQLKSTVIHLADSDANSWIDRVEGTWSGSIPATLIYKKGQREFYEQSFETYKELDEIIQPFLN